MVLRAEGLVKRYGKRTVVNGVNFEVRQGEIVGLLGPNGAGKTTSFYMTTGLVVPNGGHVYLDDLEITDFPVYKHAKAGIGYLAQEASVFRKMSVEDNIASVLELTDLSEEEQKEKLDPDMFNIFNGLKLTALKDIKVVILGQDPYHEKGQAMGLAFSVPKGEKIPPSLVNIYKEIESETGNKMPSHGDLRGWARQGVLLLNTVLTVREHLANSHKGKGWEEFTDGVIKKISEEKEGVVFLLWGANARSKKTLINKNKHLILETVHPSPLSAYNGFFGCGHFNLANEYLKKIGKTPIDWSDL